MIIKGSRNKKTNIVYKKVYSVWKNMIDRCYKTNHKRYCNYGKQGYYVCDRWQTFDNFVNDIDKIDGFNFKDFLDGNLTLDKDMKEYGNKEYCLEKCCWISKEKNNKYKPNQQIEIIAISPTGVKYIFCNQSQFAKEHNLSQSKISECLSGKRSGYKHWKFFRKN